MSLEINPRNPKKPADGVELPLLGEMLDEFDKAVQEIQNGKPKKPKPHAPASAAVAVPEPVTSDTEK